MATTKRHASFAQRTVTMPSNKLFGPTIALARQALDLRMHRQGLIHANLANANTPGYTGRELDFRRALAGAGHPPPPLARTDPRHLAGVDEPLAGLVRDRGRPVDLDEEMVDLAENGIMYQTTSRLVAKKLEGLRYAIDEGGK